RGADGGGGVDLDRDPDRGRGRHFLVPSGSALASIGVMRRRTFLAALGSSLLAASLPRLARAQTSFRLKSVARDALGTTLVLGLPHAPFAGFGYEDDTVITFVPAHYRYRAEEGVAALVHFHGHNTTAERAIAAHELREQLADSRQNAILVVPQLAVFAA